MEEKALIANIATILSKDLLMDNCAINNCKPVYQKLLEDDSDDGDEAFNFFLRQRAKQAQTAAKNSKTKPNTKRANTTNMDSDLNGLQFKVIKLQKPTKGSTELLHYPELNLHTKYDDAEFESLLHVSKNNFQLMLQRILTVFTQKDADSDADGAELPKTPTENAAMETAFSLSMWKLCTDEHFEEIARKFQIPLDNCQQIIRRFWHNVSDKYESFIKWPNSLHSQQCTLDGFRSKPELRCFNQLFGIVAHKCLDIYLAREDADIPVVVQIVCNAQKQIIDCFVELAQDYSFEHSPIGQTLAWNARTMPKGSYLIGGQSFPLKSYLIRPIEAECFQKDKIFNEYLKPAVALAEQTLDWMAARFNTLYSLEARDLCEVRQIVETICSLHNLCLDAGDDYVQRHQQLAKSNWASSTNKFITLLNGNEKDPKGLARRGELIDNLVSDIDNESKTK